MTRVGLAQVPGKIAEITGLPAPKYRRVYDAAVEGRIPAEFNSRWTVADADMPKIAAALGLVRVELPKPGKPARKAAAASVSIAA